MSKFQKTVSRIMSVEEAAGRAVAMNVSQATLEFIKKEFTMATDYRSEWCCECGSEGLEAGVGDEGRLALGQSWSNVYEDLGKAMKSDGTDDRIDEIFDAFFEE